MAKNWNGATYNENWEPIDGMGNVLGPKDHAANAAYAAATNTQNPYTNEAGGSPYDKSGLVPGNEAGTTLPSVNGTASRTPAYVQGNQWAPLSSLLKTGPTRRTLPPAYASGDVNGIEPWLTTPPAANGHSFSNAAIESLIDSLMASSTASALGPEDSLMARIMAELEGGTTPIRIEDGGAGDVASLIESILANHAGDTIDGESGLSRLARLLSSGV